MVSTSPACKKLHKGCARQAFGGIRIVMDIKNAKDLLLHGLPEGSELDDKVYLTCNLSQVGRDWMVLVNDHCPLVALNDKWAQAAAQRFGVSVETVPHIQTSKQGSLFLLSAGVLLHLEDQIALQKRDEAAPSYPGAYTEPSGRCGERPSLTLIKELNEELLFRQENGHDVEIFPVAIEGMEDEAIKVRQSQIVSLGLQNAVIMPPIYAEETHSQKGGAHIIVDGNIIESIHGDHWFDPKNSTLELRKHFRLSTDALPPELKITDGESYGRESGFFSLADIRNLPMTPYLEYYVRKTQGLLPRLDHIL